MKCNAILQYKMMDYPKKSSIFADMNNFNYTTVPGDLLYLDRRHLDDFDVDNTKSLNYLIEKEFDRMYGTYPDYEDFANNVFNTAYCICTMILADSHPQRRFGAYLTIIYDSMQDHTNEVGVVLSIILIQIKAHNWENTKSEINSLALKFFYEIEKKYGAIFYGFYQSVIHRYEERAPYTVVPPDNVFYPREITMGVLKRTCSHWDWKRHFGTDMEKMLEFIFAIGKNEDEQKIIASFLQEQTHTSFTNGAEHNYCFEHIERQIFLKYHADEEKARIDAEIDAEIEEQAIKEIEYSFAMERLPIVETENAKLRAEIEDLKKRIPVFSYDEENKGLSITYGINNVEDYNGQEKEKQSPIENADDNLQQQLAESQKIIEELNKKNLELISNNEELSGKLKKLEIWDTDEEHDILDDTQKLTLHQKIVFFTTVTSVLLDKKYTHLDNFAAFIATMCNEKKSVIGPMLSRITHNEDNDFKTTLAIAAQSVSDMLAKIMKTSTKDDETQVINRIRKNLVLNYPMPDGE
jgi:hypothetical protein